MTTAAATVLTDFVRASTPVSAYAKSLAEAAIASKSVVGRHSGIKGLATARNDIFKINPYLISVKPGLNSRIIASAENREHIDDLARSIAVNGVVTPLTVFWENSAPVLTDGECRLLGTFRAIEVYGAEIVSVPVKTESKSSSDVDRLLTQIISNSGKQFNLLEMADVYKKLEDLGQLPQQIAHRAAVSISKVHNLLLLGSVPAPIKQLVLDGRIAASTAWEAKRGNSDEKAIEIVTAALDRAEQHGQKATKRSVVAAKSKPPSLKAAILSILDASKIEVVQDTATIVMSSSNYQMLRDLLEF